jgi:hypothetical protein
MIPASPRTESEIHDKTMQTSYGEDDGRVTGGQCYGHYLWRLSPNFGDFSPKFRRFFAKFRRVSPISAKNWRFFLETIVLNSVAEEPLKVFCLHEKCLLYVIRDSLVSRTTTS